MFPNKYLVVSNFNIQISRSLINRGISFSFWIENTIPFASRIFTLHCIGNHCDSFFMNIFSCLMNMFDCLNSTFTSKVEDILIHLYVAFNIWFVIMIYLSMHIFLSVHYFWSFCSQFKVFLSDSFSELSKSHFILFWLNTQLLFLIFNHLLQSCFVHFTLLFVVKLFF